MSYVNFVFLLCIFVFFDQKFGKNTTLPFSRGLSRSRRRAMRDAIDDESGGRDDAMTCVTCALQQRKVWAKQGSQGRVSYGWCGPPPIKL